jgi:glycosyltransferase involved in cell wall biosynthesis
MMIAGLRLNGVIVSECHQSLWRGIDDRVRIASGNWVKPSFWWRIFTTYWRLLQSYLHTGEYDVLIVGYPGQLDVFLARILSWLKRKPLVLDVFMSIYLISVERGLDRLNPFSIKLLHFLEWAALKVPDRLILDTDEYVQWFEKNYKTSARRFRLVPTGADDRIFHPGPNALPKDGKFRVLYSGTYIPNHGVMFMVEAAKILSNHHEIVFQFIGNGPELEQARAFAAQNQLVNVNFIEWMEKERLVEHIRRADVCLGAFGTTPQSMMTVQNKIYEAIAVEKPLISGDSPAARDVFTHGENIYLCQRGSGSAIAEAILTLFKDPTLQTKIADNGYSLFKKKYDLLHNGQRYKLILEEMTG